MLKLATIALFASLGAPLCAGAQTWEYRVEEVDLITKVRVFANDLLLSADDLEGVLEPLGAEGWELVGSVSRGGTSLLLVFKRHAAPQALPIQTRQGEPPGPSPDKGGAVPSPVAPTAPPDPAPAADPGAAEPAPTPEDSAVPTDVGGLR